MKVTKNGTKIVLEYDLNELVEGENIFNKNKPVNNSSESDSKWLRKSSIDFLNYLKTKYEGKEIILKNKDIQKVSFKLEVRDPMAVIRREIKKGRFEVVRRSETNKIISVRFKK